VKISIEEADIILFVVDAQSGITPLDEELAGVIRKEYDKAKRSSGKKVMLVVNKVDTSGIEADLSSSSTGFYRLGLGEPVDVSALVGRKSGDLLDLITEHLDLAYSPLAREIKGVCRIAVIGRPNVGKSSIVNAVTQSNRNIVTDIPGTTRDAIDTTIKYYGQEITLVDTAGLRKKSRIKKAESLEFYSAIRTQRSIENCDVAVIVLDATAMVTKLEKSSDYELATFKLGKEDSGIIYDAAKMKKGMLVVVNKWDLVEKKSDSTKIFESKVKEHMQTYNYLPFLFVSALTKQRVSKILEQALKVYAERAKEIRTSELNSKLLKVINENPPYSKTKREVKINYITQLKTSPPVIGFFTNLPTEIEENYRRFLESKIRQFFGFTGVPLTLVFKKKN
jgi:GTP-binding protein